MNEDRTFAFIIEDMDEANYGQRIRNSLKDTAAVQDFILTALPRIDRGRTFHLLKDRELGKEEIPYKQLYRQFNDNTFNNFVKEENRGKVKILSNSKIELEYSGETLTFYLDSDKYKAEGEKIKVVLTKRSEVFNNKKSKEKQ